MIITNKQYKYKYNIKYPHWQNVSVQNRFSYTIILYHRIQIWNTIHYTVIAIRVGSSDIHFFDLKSDMPKINTKVKQLFHEIFNKKTFILRCFKIENRLPKKLRYFFKEFIHVWKIKIRNSEVYIVICHVPPLIGLKRVKNTCAAILLNLNSFSTFVFYWLLSNCVCKTHILKKKISKNCLGDKLPTINI